MTSSTGKSIRRGRPARERANGVARAATGIEGFDEITGGGLPRGRPTLLAGGPGTGKTLFALASLVHGATRYGERGLFVAFEESPKSIVTNASGLGWNIPALVQPRRLVFHDARLSESVIQGGTFDLHGLLAGIGALVKRTGARRLVLDGVDALLGSLGDAVLERREMFALNRWLARSGLTSILTAKTEGLLDGSGPQYPYLPYLVDAVVLFRVAVEDQMAHRRIRVAKFRGASHSSNEFPLLISSLGVEVATYGPPERTYPAPMETVSSGVDRLDTMLGGGYYRGSSILVSGAPGTAKSTLSAAFALAACRRHERTLYVSLDESADQILRNMASVGMDLAPYVARGLLRLQSIHPRADSADEHLARVRIAMSEHRAQNLVVDPISAFGGTSAQGHSDPGKRMMDFAKARGATTVMTSLLEGPDTSAEASSAGVSTIADTWIHLSYVIRSGERNRALTIVKSRGMGHSNQVRELTLSGGGITLTDVYTAGGEVLMGALRWEKERTEEAERARMDADSIAQREQQELALTEGRARLAVLQREIGGRVAALERFDAARHGATTIDAARRSGIETLRQGDKGVDTGASRAGRRRRRPTGARS
jgi:circadian clock protein KaiC